MLLGVVLLLGSCLLFGEMLRTEAANEAMSIPIKVGTEITTDFVNVQTSKNCMIAFDLTVQSEKVHISQSTDPQTSEPEEEYKLQYGFPLTYRVLDANGNTIHSKTTKIAWKSDELYTDRGDVDSPDGGTITVKRKFTTFKVRDPGRLQVRVEVQPDSEFGAELSSAHLIVYDNVPEPDDSVLRGFAFYIASPLLATAYHSGRDSHDRRHDPFRSGPDVPHRPPRDTLLPETTRSSPSPARESLRESAASCLVEWASINLHWASTPAAW